MKVLLLDTAFAAAPIYNYLVAADHEVWVMGNRASDPLAQLAGKRWIAQDYSDVAAVAGHVRDHGFERVVPGCTDVSIDTCARLEVMRGNMDSAETNEKLGNKAVFRRICAEIGMRAPRVVSPDELPLDGKLICKPVDAFSGRGISTFDGTDKDACMKALSTGRAASPSSLAVIETFVEGDLHSCTAFLESGRIVDPFYVIEGSSSNPFAVDTSHVTDAVPAAFRDELERSLEALAERLGLCDGLLHTQFILAQDGAYVVEVARRCPGDLYSLLIEYSTGYPYAARYASFFLGESVESRKPAAKHILRHTVTADDDCVYSGLRFERPLPIKSFFPLLAMGQAMFGRQGNRAGILFCEAGDLAELSALYREFLARGVYRVS